MWWYWCRCCYSGRCLCCARWWFWCCYSRGCLCCARLCLKIKEAPSYFYNLIPTKHSVTYWQCINSERCRKNWTRANFNVTPQISQAKMFAAISCNKYVLYSRLWDSGASSEYFVWLPTVLLESNANEIRWISMKIDEISHLSNFLRKFCFILYKNSLSPLKFRWENSKGNFVRSNIRFEVSNSMCMKLRSFDWLYSINNSITKTVKVRHSLHVILFCLSHDDQAWHGWKQIKMTHCTYKSGYIPPNTSR